MLIEVLSHLLSFDFGWIFSLLINNLPWIFAMGAAAYFFFQGKNPLLGFIVLVTFIWSLMDFTKSIGWLYLVAGFLTVHYITRMAMLTFASDVPALKNKLLLIAAFQYWIWLTIFNLFFAG